MSAGAMPQGAPHTKESTEALFQLHHALSRQERRDAGAIIAGEEADMHCFMPRAGMTVGTFAVYWEAREAAKSRPGDGVLAAPPSPKKEEES